MPVIHITRVLVKATETELKRGVYTIHTIPVYFNYF